MMATTDLTERARLLHETRDTALTTTRSPLPGATAGPISLATDVTKEGETPIRYAWRSFDRQWIIPDARLIHDPRRPLWQVRNAPGQLFLTGLMAHTSTNGPALTATALIPDLHHYKGSFGGRAWPLWLDTEGTVPNVVPGVLDVISVRLGRAVGGRDLFAYVAAIAANVAYTSCFVEDLVIPGLRLPLTAERACFEEAISLGARVLWLFTYGQRFDDSAEGRPYGAPRLDAERRPQVTVAIPDTEADMPEAIDFDPVRRELAVGEGRIAPVELAVWEYEVSGMKVLKHWFERRAREPRGRRSSHLDTIVAKTWNPDWTTELLETLNVLTLLIDLAPTQADLLGRVLDGSLITVDDLVQGGVNVSERPTPAAPGSNAPRMFDVDL